MRAASLEEGRPPFVLVVGDVMIDILVRPEGPLAIGADRRAAIRTAPGGSGANQAAWLAAHGVNARFAGRVGRDDHALQMQLLKAAGVEPALGRDDRLTTGTLVALISPDGERSFLTDRGANSRLCRADLPATLLDGVDLLQVSGYALFERGPREAVRELMGEALRRDIPVSVDPASHSWLAEVGPDSFLEWTKGARICFPNAAEAAILAGTADPDKQLSRLSRSYELVVMKRSGEGAIAAAGSERWTAAPPLTDCVDTSGAGDAFLAGFLASYLRGATVQASLQGGVAAGARAVTELGAWPLRPMTPLQLENSEDKSSPAS